MTDAFDEIQQSIKDERAHEIWNKYGKTVLGIALLVVGVTAAYSGYTAVKTSKQIEATDLALAYYNDEKPYADIQGDETYAPLLLLQAANTALENSNKDEAIALLEKARSAPTHNIADQGARDLAVLLLSRLETLNIHDVAFETGFWQTQFWIDKAVLAATEHNFTEAQNYLELAQEGATPPSLMRVINQLSHVYKLRMIDQKDQQS